MKYRFPVFSFFATLALFFLPQLVAGQFSFNQNLTLSLAPAFPGPNENVYVRIDPAGTDLSRADINWFVDGELIKRGVGLTSFSFTTKNLGESSTIITLVKMETGQVLQQSITIRPATVRLLWEASSYVPPFYKGKALYPYQGIVRVIALPLVLDSAGRTIDPENLVYKWIENYKVDLDSSGYGKDVFGFNGDVIIRPTTVRVEVSTLDKNTAVAGEITVTPIEPHITFYENHPLYGQLWNKAIGQSVSLTENEIQIAAVPYFFGVHDKNNPTLTYSWNLNNQPVSAGTQRSILTLRQPENVGGGTASLGLEVSNTALSSIYQSARINTTVNFTARGRESGGFPSGTR